MADWPEKQKIIEKKIRQVFIAQILIMIFFFNNEICDNYFLRLKFETHHDYNRGKSWTKVLIEENDFQLAVLIAIKWPEPQTF